MDDAYVMVMQTDDQTALCDLQTPAPRMQGKRSDDEMVHPWGEICFDALRPHTERLTAESFIR